MQERSCYLEKSRKVAQKKGLLPGCRNAEKSRTKKQTSRIADNSRKSEKIRTKKRVLTAAGLRKMRESAHEKKEPAACLEILEALKGDAPSDQGVIRADRAGLMLNCCKKWR